MATWYAQKSGNINSVSSGTTSDVWNSAANGSGTWMDISVLTAGGTDTVLAPHSNTTGYTITINISIDIGTGRLSTAAEGAGYSGGGFSISGPTGRIITANVLAGSTACVTSTHTGTGPSRVAVYGQILGSAVNAPSLNTWQQQGSGDLVVSNVGGDAVVGGSANSAARGILASSSAKNIYIFGNVRGLVGAGIYVSNAAYIEVTGDVSGGSGGHGITLTNSGATFAIYGSVSGGTGGRGITCSPGLSGAITGNATAGSGADTEGVYSSGVVTIVGSIIDSLNASGATGAIRWQPTPGVHYRKTYFDGSTPKYYTLAPAAADVKTGVVAGFADPGVVVTGTLALPADTDVRLGVGSGVLELPLAADVETGVGYGANGTEFEGVLALPAEADVKLGVRYGANGTEFTGLARLAEASGGVIPPLPMSMLQEAVTHYPALSPSEYGDVWEDTGSPLPAYLEPMENRSGDDVSADTPTMWMMTPPSTAISVGDKVVYNGVSYLAHTVEVLRADTAVHHYETSLTEVG